MAQALSSPGNLVATNVAPSLVTSVVIDEIDR
jgi:hypothetical protein